MVGLVVGTSLLAACTGGGGGAEEGASEAPSSSPSSPVVSSSSEAAVPVLPDEARGDDDAAAVAFVEHWVELVNYALRTGDIEPLEAVTGPSCGTCEVLYADLADRGGRDASGRWTFLDGEVRQRQAADLGPADVIVESGVTIGETSGSEGTIAAGLDRDGSEWVVSWATADQS